MPLNGARLREAREARELSGVALARKVGLAPSTISKYESGDKHPPPAVIDALAEVLDLPVTFLTRESQPDYSDRLTFRSRSAASKALRVRETRLFHWTVEIAGFLRGVALFPQVNFPEYDVPDDPRALSNDQIDEIAESIRKFWKLGDRPVPSVVEVLEDNGAMVVRREVGSELIDAYSEWRYGIPHIILAADKFAAARSRLDAAHELGHLLLHRSAPAELMNQPAITKMMEDQATFFAGAFLLPTDSFVDEFLTATVHSLLNLKLTWRVSVGAMIKRLAWLNLITPEQETALWISMSRRGWRRREPHDEQLLVEEPQLVRSALELGYRTGKVSLGVLRMSLPYAVADIEYLLGLPHGHISQLPARKLEAQPEILQFRT